MKGRRRFPRFLSTLRDAERVKVSRCEIFSVPSARGRLYGVRRWKERKISGRTAASRISADRLQHYDFANKTFTG